MNSSEPDVSSQQTKLSQEKTLLDLSFDKIGEEDEEDESVQVSRLVDLHKHVIEAYFSERFAPSLLPNPLSNSYISQLRYAIGRSISDLRQTCPSLEPRDRIEYLAKNQAFHRSVYILQSFVMIRLAKLLLDPFFFQKRQPHGHYASQQTPVASRGLTNNLHASSQNISETFPTKRSEEEETLHVLERAFAQEVQCLWKSFSLLAPSPNTFQLVHAKILTNKQEISLKDFHLTPFSTEMLSNLHHQSTLDGASKSSTPLSSQDSISTSYLTPGTVWTLNYDIVRELVENGKVGLTG